jgi:hypothetical protein
MPSPMPSSPSDPVGAALGAALPSEAERVADLLERAPVDRRLANRNLRTALIAGTIIVLVFALSWLVGLVY